MQHHLGARTALALAALALTVAACGEAGSGSSSSGTDAQSQTAGPVQGPPSATLTLSGDAGVAGPISNVSSRIICSLPGLTGMAITDFGTTATPSVTAFIILKSSAVEVRLSAGSGSTLTERIFSGRAAPGFSTARGGAVVSALNETTPAGTKRGSVGAATSIDGRVDCGNEVAGSSSVTVSGLTKLGQASGGFETVRVVCETYSGGRAVGIIGITHVGPTAVQFNVSLNNTGTMTVFYASSDRNSGFFVSASGTSNGTLSANGAHFDGTANDSQQTGHTFTVKGDATCGSTASY